MSSNFAGATVLVAGGAGFIGSHLCAELCARGADVTCIDSLITGVRPARNLAQSRACSSRGSFRFIEADICRSIELDRRFDFVFNLASLASPTRYMQFPLETLKVGSIGVMHTQEVASRDGARYIFSSTSEVYGNPTEHPQRETYRGNVDPIGPRSPYDESKRFAEAYLSACARKDNLNVGIARIFNTYGPGMQSDDGRAVPEFIRAALRGRPIKVTGDGTQSRSLMYIDDCVSGILKLAAVNDFGPYNLGTSDEITMLELATRVIAITGGTSPITFVPPSPDDPTRRRADTSKALAGLGWQPQVSLDDGLRNTIDSFRGRRFE